MKKRIGKFFIILGVIFFCLTPFSIVKAEDNYHYNVFNILDNNGRQIGSAEYVLYEDSSVAHDRKYVSELTINFAAYYRGPVTISRRTYQSDYIIVEGANISSGSDSSLMLWLAGSNYVHVKWYSSANFNTGGYYPADVFVGSGLTQVELSPGESRQEIIDALDTSNNNWTSLLQQMNELKNLFGVGSNIQNVDQDSIRGMLNTIRSELLAIGVLDGVIAAKVAEISDIVDQAELINSQLADIATDVSIIADNFDMSGLQSAIADLETAINNLAGNIQITNNIDFNIIPQYSINAYYWFGKFNNNGISNDLFNFPNLYITSTVSGSYQSSRRLYVEAHRTLIIAAISSVTLNFSNFPYYFNETVSDSSFVPVEYSIKSFSDYKYQYITITNNYSHTISVSFDYTGFGARILPFYIGYVDLMTDEVSMTTQYNLPDVNSEDYNQILQDIFDAVSAISVPDYSDTLDDILDAINNISMNVDYNEVNSTVNNFNIDIDTVHNTETNILNSFNTYRQLFNTGVLDSTDWFSPTLFHYLFNNVWTTSNSHIGWIITLILFCVLILAVIGLRK